LKQQSTACFKLVRSFTEDSKQDTAARIAAVHTCTTPR